MGKRGVLITQKIVKKYGDTVIVGLSKEDLKLSGLEVGDPVNMKLELIE